MSWRRRGERSGWVCWGWSERGKSSRVDTPHACIALEFTQVCCVRYLRGYLKSRVSNIGSEPLRWQGILASSIYPNPQSIFKTPTLCKAKMPNYLIRPFKHFSSHLVTCRVTYSWYSSRSRRILAESVEQWTKVMSKLCCLNRSLRAHRRHHLRPSPSHEY